jgi:adenylate cyclase
MSKEQESSRTSPVAVKRKLTAILAADVQGYSRLMGEDEVATLKTLTAYRGVTDALIAQYHGRIVNTAGDSILAEFASVVDAVQCAVEIQRELGAKNAELPTSRRMAFRIGINLGDVMVEGEQIYGDGVNIAARLESLAEGGGICISGVVHDQVKNKLALAYEDLGQQTVKNIAEPVRVYRIVMKVPSPFVGEGQGEGAAREEGSSRFKVQSSKPRRVRSAHRIVVGLLLITAAIVAVWYFTRPLLSPQSSSLVTQEVPALPLPDKPSIVVLPFTNMSNDPEQEYFSDGMTEDITSDLSKLSGLFVIARNSAFTYKGKAVKVQDVGRELGIRYILEGSVRKANNQVRITAQLVDATTGGQLWSERYDRPLTDIFALQDEIRQRIVFALEIKITPEEQERFKRAPTNSLEAYDYFLRGQEAFFSFSKESLQQARPMFARALELDPHYAGAYAAASVVDASLYYFWTPDPQILEQAFDSAQKAVALDDSLALAHSALGRLYLVKKQHEQAIVETERAIALDPNNAAGYANLGFILNWAGQPEKTIGLVETAMRLDPRYPSIYLVFLGQAYRLTGRYEDAVSTYKKAIIRTPDILGAHAGLAVTYTMIGKDKEAQAEVEEILRLNPHYSLENSVQRIWPYKDPTLLERDLAALRKAGLK